MCAAARSERRYPQNAKFFWELGYLPMVLSEQKRTNESFEDTLVLLLLVCIPYTYLFSRELNVRDFV